MKNWYTQSLLVTLLITMAIGTCSASWHPTNIGQEIENFSKLHSTLESAVQTDSWDELILFVRLSALRFETARLNMQKVLRITHEFIRNTNDPFAQRVESLLQDINTIITMLNSIKNAINNPEELSKTVQHGNLLIFALHNSTEPEIRKISSTLDALLTTVEITLRLEKLKKN